MSSMSSHLTRQRTSSHTSQPFHTAPRAFPHCALGSTRRLFLVGPCRSSCESGAGPHVTVHFKAEGVQVGAGARLPATVTELSTWEHWPPNCQLQIQYSPAIHCASMTVDSMRTHIPQHPRARSAFLNLKPQTQTLYSSGSSFTW